jgi:hypothetical protein
MSVMEGDLVTLAADAVPYASAVLGPYGGAVLAKVRDDLADKADAHNSWRDMIVNRGRG